MIFCFALQSYENIFSLIKLLSLHKQSKNKNSKALSKDVLKYFSKLMSELFLQKLDQRRDKTRNYTCSSNTIYSPVSLAPQMWCACSPRPTNSANKLDLV